LERGDSELGDRREEKDPLPDLDRSVELLRRHRLGDPRALNELFGRYAPSLLRVIRTRMGSLAQFCDPEDVMQETFLVAFDRMRELEVRTRYGILAYLSRIAENQIRRLRRYHDAKRRDPRREQVAAEWTTSPARDSTPSRIVSRAEEEERVGRLVGELSPDDFRTVLLLRDYEGASWEEIQGELGRPSIRAVRELYRRAVQKLARRLAPRRTPSGPDPG